MAIAWALIVFLARRSGFVDRLDSRVAVNLSAVEGWVIGKSSQL
jgi:hypothetical protein